MSIFLSRSFGSCLEEALAVSRRLVADPAGAAAARAAQAARSRASSKTKAARDSQ